MFASTSTAFASDNTDNGTEDNKNDDLLDLLGEIDAEIEGEFSDEFTLKSVSYTHLTLPTKRIV